MLPETVVADASGQGLARASGHGTFDVTAGHTGRTYSGGEGYRAAKEWADCMTVDELLAHPGRREFKKRLAEVQLVRGPAMRCFRAAAAIHPSRESVPRMNKWDLLPVDGTGPGPLYLCAEAEGVRRELSDDKRGTLYIQEYRIPTNRLRVAEFVDLPLRLFY